MPRMPRRGLIALAAASVLGVALLAFGELEAWRTSRAGYPRMPRPRADGREVVLVLGYRPKDDGSINWLQKWRVRIAQRSAGPDALFVISGGIVHGTRPEADIMAEYALARGIPPSRIAREREATSTRENLAFSMPWLRDAGIIRIASNTAHARRARGYLAEQAPELALRLAPTRDFVPLELGPLRLALTFYDWVAGRVAARRDADTAKRDADTAERLTTRSRAR